MKVKYYHNGSDDVELCEAHNRTHETHNVYYYNEDNVLKFENHLFILLFGFNVS